MLHKNEKNNSFSHHDNEIKQRQMIAQGSFINTMRK